MHSPFKHCWTLALSIAVIRFVSSVSGQTSSLPDRPVQLFDDQFETLRPGPLMPVVGPHPEYHYIREAVADGPWAVTTFESSYASQLAWRSIRLDDGSAAIGQFYKNKAKHWHPMIVAGEPVWQDYQLSAKLQLDQIQGRFGVAVRQRNDRCYYFIGVNDSKAVIIKVQHEVAFQVPGESVLASIDLDLKKESQLSIEASVDGDRIQAIIAGKLIEAKDDTFQSGRVALLADVPVQYLDLRVTCDDPESKRIEQSLAANREAERKLENGLPRPKLWKKIFTPQFGTDRNIRFGDLNGDQRIDLLIGQVMHHGPTDSNSELSCLTAIDLEGEVLWTVGVPDRWRNHLTNDVAFQVHDLDGDGKAEVIYTMNQEIIIAEGATGKRIRSVPTPTNTNTKPPYNTFPRVLGDSLIVADLRGNKHRRDIILKDRYQFAWAMDEQLNPLWKVECNTGHFPFPVDLEGDGREEVSLGYSLISPDGKSLWSHDLRYKDHCDSNVAVDLDGDGALEFLLGSSDEGLIVLDSKGVPRAQLRLGHVQNLTIADLRPDLPGLEIASANFWKNQGLIHIMDCRANIVADFEPRPEHGSSIIPVHWKGDGSELLFLGPDSLDGGLFDGHGRRVLKLPADGHPTKVYDALDLTGDSRDELIVWDAQEIWIYTQLDPAGEVDKKVVSAPKRNSLSNESNYRARVSIPSGFK